ncbi:unnamed protein product [Coccothraustes coccothraustes]
MCASGALALSSPPRHHTLEDEGQSASTHRGRQCLPAGGEEEERNRGLPARTSAYVLWASAERSMRHAHLTLFQATMGKRNDLAERPSTLLSLRAPAEKPEQLAVHLCL